MSESHNRRILHVDDDPTDAELFREALHAVDMDGHLEWLDDGVVALARLRREGKYAETLRPDLVVLDHQMPKVTGRDILRAMKQDPGLRQIPVLMLTNSDDPKDIFEAYDIGVNGYVGKPAGFTDLIQIAKSIKAFWFDAALLPHGKKPTLSI